MTTPVTIVGGGLAGALLAVLLRRRGFPVTVFERRPDPRLAPVAGGRSINLALAERGLHALALAGVLDAVLAEAVPMRGRMIHERDGRLRFEPYGPHPGDFIRSVHRARLNLTLLAAAEEAGAELRFAQVLEDGDLAAGRLLFRGPDGGLREERAAIVIGADGVASAVRRLIARERPVRERLVPLDHGYKEIHLAPRGGDFALDPGALHIWPRVGHMLIALPNADRSFTCTLFLPHRAAAGPSFAWLAAAGEEELEDWIAAEFPDARALVPDFAAQLRAHPLGELGTLWLEGWHLGGRALLVGDAAHAIVPFHGQGMNAAFEDCAALAEALDRAGGEPDWARIFADFERERRPDTDAIAAMALENYEEMRARVLDPRFLLQRQAERELERRHPGRFRSRYAMVMFTRLPYREALRRGREQQAVFDRVLAGRSALGEAELLALEQAFGLA
ncbi:MAG: NAD(P)/FAD-dependent oxidoreductase [Xanthomonadales bacterium]|nr:NAD(P)/FAD-dependent oxidoreductase [Xanthomonadales bacterium]